MGEETDHPMGRGYAQMHDGGGGTTSAPLCVSEEEEAYAHDIEFGAERTGTRFEEIFVDGDRLKEFREAPVHESSQEDFISPTLGSGHVCAAEGGGSTGAKDRHAAEEEEEEEEAEEDEEIDAAGLINDDFEEIHAGRRIVFEYPITRAASSSVSVRRSVTAVVLDSPMVEDEDLMQCAAMLVPLGKEEAWIYSSEGGQWQLLASAGVRRLILLLRTCDPELAEPRNDDGASSRSGREFPKTDGANAEGRGICDRKNGRISIEEHPALDKATGGSAEVEHGSGEVRQCSSHREDNDGEHRNAQDKERNLDDSRSIEDPVGPDKSKMEEVEVELLKARRSCLVVVAENAEENDSELKKILRPLILTLAPKISFKRGGPDIPFVTYTDNVVQRVVIDVVYSPLTGMMMVEDVEVESEKESDEKAFVPKNYQQWSSREEGSSQLVPSSCLMMGRERSKSWRRRLIFKRMPNLIQTEVPLRIRSGRDVDQDRKRQKKHGSRRSHRRAKGEAVVKRVDHSKLVHIYLPPIVAGFVLVTPCLDACFMSQLRARVLCIGVGGGALPMFLHNQFWFQIQVVELDEVVLRLAEKHFCLKEDPHVQVAVGDGAHFVEDIASKAIQVGLVNHEWEEKWRHCVSYNENCPPLPSADLSPGDSASDQVDPPPTNVVSSTNVENSSTEHEVRVNDWCEDPQGVGVIELSENEHAIGPENAAVKDKIVSEDVAVSSSSEQIKSTQTDVHSTVEVASRDANVAHFPYNCRFDKDPRVEIIVVDVDVGDPRFELSSPPMAFIERKFILSARIALQDGGMLAMNVVSCVEKAYEGVITSLKGVFAEVYEIELENEINRVVFALPKPVSYNHLVGPTLQQVQRVVDGGLIQRIRRLDSTSGGASGELVSLPLTGSAGVVH